MGHRLAHRLAQVGAATTTDLAPRKRGFEGDELVLQECQAGGLCLHLRRSRKQPWTFGLVVGVMVVVVVASVLVLVLSLVYVVQRAARQDKNLRGSSTRCRDEAATNMCETITHHALSTT
jgi:hypothetical protein